MRLTESTTLFVASATQATTPMTLAEVMDAVRGGSRLEDLGVFTARHEADDYHDRAKLLAEGAELLAGLGMDDLRKMVSMVKDTRINDLLDKCGA